MSDHYFLAAQRWLYRNDVASVGLACHSGAETALGTKRRAALEIPACLRDLPAHRLVDLWLSGVRDVAATPGMCCGTHDLAAVVDRWCATLGELLTFSVIEASPVRSWSWSLSPTRVPVDRRGLLGLHQGEQPWPTHAVDADDQARMLTSLRAAGVRSLPDPPPGLALLTSGCTACGVCVAACPHDALSLDVVGPKTSLNHAPDVCRGEQRCVVLCPVDALTVAGALPWAAVLDAEPQVLASVRTSVCARCQARFPADSGSSWCEPCRIRRSDPFGSHLPAAAIELLRSRGA